MASIAKMKRKPKKQQAKPTQGVRAGGMRSYATQRRMTAGY